MKVCIGITEEVLIEGIRLNWESEAYSKKVVGASASTTLMFGIECPEVSGGYIFRMKSSSESSFESPSFLRIL